MDIQRYLWIFRDIYGYLEIFMDIQRYLWIFRDIYGYPWAALAVYPEEGGDPSSKWQRFTRYFGDMYLWDL